MNKITPEQVAEALGADEITPVKNRKEAHALYFQRHGMFDSRGIEINPQGYEINGAFRESDTGEWWILLKTPEGKLLQIIDHHNFIKNVSDKYAKEK